MEELLIIIIQFLIEVVGQALIQIPFDCSCRVRERGESRPVLLSFIFFLLGGLIGWASTKIVPWTMITIPALRVLNVFIAPLIGGFIGYRIAQWQARIRNPNIEPTYHFWYGFFFTIALAAVRFAYVRRGAI